MCVCCIQASRNLQLSLQGYDLAFASGPKRFLHGKVPNAAARLVVNAGLRCPFCNILCDSQAFYDLHLEWKHKDVRDARAKLLETLKEPKEDDDHLDEEQEIEPPEKKQALQRPYKDDDHDDEEDDDMLDLASFKLPDDEN